MSRQVSDESRRVSRGQQSQDRLRLFALNQELPPDIKESFMTIVQFGLPPDQVKDLYIKFREELGASSTQTLPPNMEYQIGIPTGPDTMTAPVTSDQGGRTAPIDFAVPCSVTGPSPEPTAVQMVGSMGNPHITPAHDQTASLFSPVSMASCPENQDVTFTPAAPELQPFFPWPFPTDLELRGLPGSATTPEYGFRTPQRTGGVHGLGISYSGFSPSQIIATTGVDTPTYAPSPTQYPHPAPSTRKQSIDRSSTVPRSVPPETRSKDRRSSKITKPVPKQVSQRHRHRSSLTSHFNQTYQQAEIANSASSQSQARSPANFPTPPSFSSYRTPQPSPRQVSEPYSNHSLLASDSELGSPHSSFVDTYQLPLSDQGHWALPATYPPHYPPSSS